MPTRSRDFCRDRHSFLPALEPTLAILGRGPLRYVFATRPPFLLASVVPVLLGIAWAYRTGHAIDGWRTSLAVFAAVLLHAGINILNDYHDDRIGTDAINSDRIFPFTGGSRLIQNGVLTDKETLRFGLRLWVAAAFLGIVLAAMSGPWLYTLGLLGLFLGWAYSTPPLSLNSRGLGEPCVAIGFGLLPVTALAGLLAAIPSGLAARQLLHDGATPSRREPSIRRTLAAMIAYGLLTTAASVICPMTGGSS